MGFRQNVTKVNRLSGEFITVGAFSPTVHIGNVKENVKEILRVIKESDLKDCELVVTPELSLTGYSCQDMFFNKKLLNDVKSGLEELKSEIGSNMILSVGAPMMFGNALFNCSILLSKSKIISITPKTYIANYAEFYEDRWFTSYDPDAHQHIEQLGLWVNNISRVNVTQTFMSHNNIPFSEDPEHEEYMAGSYSIGCEICEDLWGADPVSTHMALAGAEIIVNNSASNETIGKADYRRSLVKTQSARTISAYIYCSAGLTESSQDIVFGGHNIIAENGRVLAESDLFDISGHGIVIATLDLGVIRHDRMLNKTFSSKSKPKMKIKYKEESVGFYIADLKYNIYRDVPIAPFVPNNMAKTEKRCEEIFNMQVAGLTSRLLSRGKTKIVIGVSGGLDSTLALLVAYAAIKKLGPVSNIVGVTMPCFGTTDRTKSNAVKLMEQLGCTIKTIDIKESVTKHLEDIEVSMEDRTVTYENAQARERTQVLMDVANKVGGFVLGTGDMSELALGWCTYNGDQMSMYNVNGSIPKTLVRTLVDVMGHKLLSNDPSIIEDIVDTPVSPELLPPRDNGDIAQLTEESVGPYIFNDFYMYYHVRYGFSRDKIMLLGEIACKQNDMDFNQFAMWIDKFYKRFFRAQFKRNPMPDGVKVGSVSLNPRGDWRCPSEFDADGMF